MDLDAIRARITGNAASTPEVDLTDARELLAEVDRLRAWVTDLQSGMTVNCVYCGHRYGPDPGTPVAMAEVLKAHVERCPEHPMSRLRAGAVELLVASDNGREAIGRVMDLVERGSPAHDRWLEEQPVFARRHAASTSLKLILGPR